MWLLFYVLLSDIYERRPTEGQRAPELIIHLTMFSLLLFPFLLQLYRWQRGTNNNKNNSGGPLNKGQWQEEYLGYIVVTLSYSGGESLIPPSPLLVVAL